MIHIFVWPIVIAAFVVKNDLFKRIGITVGIIASTVMFIVGVETWPLQLIAIAFYWIVSFLIAKIISWVIGKIRSDK